MSALFAFVLALGSVGNLITAYELPVDGMWKIYLWCAFAATAVAVLFKIPHGRKIMAGLAGLALFSLCLAELFRPQILKQIQTLCCCITSHYHDVYNWPILGKLSASHVTVPLILWAVLVAFCVNWHFCRGRHILFAILPAVAPLAVCLVTADKVPSPVYLFLMISVLTTLLITDWTRKNQPEQGAKLVLWFVLPVALFLGLVFLCNPETNYVNRAGKLQKNLSVWFEEVQDTAEAVMTGTSRDEAAGKRINLQAVGKRTSSTRSVMVVNSPIDGKLYLRERDYDVYTGIAWEASPDRKEVFPTGGTSQGSLTILTYSTRKTLFVPYYANIGITMEGGAVENTNNLQQYRYGLSKNVSKKLDIPASRYRTLPSETKVWATELVNQITAGANTKREKVFKILNYVRNCAVYDTASPRMDGSHSDFAQWFLEDSETGYCIHYATAATILLRAAEIPARYVEGYAVTCTAGKDVVVNKQDSHAWVEYYDQETRAWCILEATPISETVQRPGTEPNKYQGGTSKPVNPQGGTTEETRKEDPFEEEPPEEDTPTEPTDAPEEPEEPTVEEPPVPGQVTEPWKMPKWMKIAIGCLLLIGCVILQGYLRILWKRKLWNRGAPNALAIWRWRKTSALANLLGVYYPEELDNLALKARFSQHEIQPDELQQFEDYRLSLLDSIEDKPWYKRAVYKWILAIG